jgi:GntR family transcriptional repressor for pyruvate dehydrogenase complex
MDEKTEIEFKPVPTKKASEAIFTEIQKAITSGKLKPGDRLPSERKLMQQFQRSRPTVREALRMLERQGLIEIIPGSQAKVLRPSLSTIEQPLENLLSMGTVKVEELVEYRQLNEVAIIRWACARRTMEDVADMRECLNTEQKAMDDSGAFMRYDVQFHSLIARASCNQIAAAVEKAMHQVIIRALYTSYMKKSVEERRFMYEQILQNHRGLLQKIEEQDADSAEKLMVEHMSSFTRELILAGKQNQ